MATIRLQRSNEFINRLRPYRIYIDGKPAGKVKNGEAVNFEVDPGSHALEARIDWCSSPVMNIEVGQEEAKEMSVRGFKNSFLFSPVFAIYPALYFILPSRIQDKYWYIWLPLLTIPAIVLVYFLSVGRRKYLTLEEHSILQNTTNAYATNSIKASTF